MAMAIENVFKNPYINLSNEEVEKRLAEMIPKKEQLKSEVRALNREIHILKSSRPSK